MRKQTLRFLFLVGLSCLCIFTAGCSKNFTGEALAEVLAPDYPAILNRIHGNLEINEKKQSLVVCLEQPIDNGLVLECTVWKVIGGKPVPANEQDMERQVLLCLVIPLEAKRDSSQGAPYLITYIANQDIVRRGNLRPPGELWHVTNDSTGKLWVLKKSAMEYEQVKQTAGRVQEAVLIGGKLHILLGGR